MPDGSEQNGKAEMKRFRNQNELSASFENSHSQITKNESISNTIGEQ